MFRAGIKYSDQKSKGLIRGARRDAAKLEEASESESCSTYGGNVK